MKHEILEGKKLSEYQKKVLHAISDITEKNYILEIFDAYEVKTTYTLTNGTDDFEDIRESTMHRLKQFSFMSHKILPSSDHVIRVKHFIQPESCANVLYFTLKKKWFDMILSATTK